MHGKSLVATDSLTSGSQLGQEIIVPVPVDPNIPRCWEVVVNWSTAAVTGTVLLTLDIRGKTGFWQDSGWPSITLPGTGSGQYTAGAVCTDTALSVRARSSGITGGTVTTNTSLVELGPLPAVSR
ncbi:MAG: hypothetical protein WB586_28635 [Chthoniobacterales bacterium]